MKKEITEVYCDDCGAKVGLQAYTSPFVGWFSKRIDLCNNCLNERLSHSFGLCEDRLCPNCRGDGQVKEGYVHNDYHWKKCEICDGKRVLPLTISGAKKA